MWFKKLWCLCYYCWCDGGYAMLSSIRVLIWLFRVWTAKTPSERTLLVSKKETAFFSRSLTLFFWFSSSSYHFSSIYFAHFVACHDAMMCHHRHNCNNKPNQSIYFLLTLFFYSWSPCHHSSALLLFSDEYTFNVDTVLKWPKGSNKY